MNRSDSCPIDILEALVYQESESLRKYRTLPTAKEAYITRQEKLISSLELALSHLREIKYFSYWKKVDERVQAFEAEDTSLTGHIIHIRTKAEGKRNSFIDIDLLYNKRWRK